MAAIPIPALHATHAGIWLASGDGEVREASRGEAIARAAETPHIILNAPLVGQRLGYPELSAGSTCSSCSRSFIRRGSRCRPRRG